LDKKLKQYERYRKLKTEAADDLYQEVAVFLLEQYPLTKNGKEIDYTNLSKEQIYEILRTFERYLRRFAKELGLSEAQRRRETKLGAAAATAGEEYDEGRDKALASDFWEGYHEKLDFKQNLETCREIIMDTDSPEATNQLKTFELYLRGHSTVETAKIMGVKKTQTEQWLKAAMEKLRKNKHLLILPEEKQVA
jgi:DNA-directed RNA polymerase specialized sigma24 family protein